MTGRDCEWCARRIESPRAERFCGKSCANHARQAEIRARRPITDRLHAGVVITDAGCWEWTGATDQDGYGLIHWANKQYRVHRLAFKVLGGRELDDGSHLHHTCETRRCINPDHLEPLDPVQHRRVHTVLHEAQPGTCRAGHPRSSENLYIDPHGSRRCRVCDRASRSRYVARQGAAA